MNARGPLLLLIFSFVTAGFAATNSSAPDRILQQELKQQQIKSTTQKVGTQLNGIIEEFQRNGIEGEDVKVLKAIGSVLGRLSEKDMERVIGLLQQARAVQDPNAATRNATDAYAGQKGIIIQLQQLVLEYQRQQALYELSLRFKEYAKRETENMWLGVSLAKETDGKTMGSFSEPQQSSLRVQQIDQETLKDEILLTLKKVEQIAKEIEEGPTAERPKLAIKQAEEGGLKPAMDSAVEDLKTAKLLSATGNEKRVRDQLRDIARILLLSQGELEALRQALREVEQTIEQQKTVQAETRKIDKEDSQKVQPRQAELVDGTDLVRRDVESLAPMAAENLKSAMDRMQEARSVFGSEKDPKKVREQAPPRQEEALASLEQARRNLMEELAKAEEKQIAPESALASLKELQEQIRQLIKDEEKLKQDTAQAEKKDLPAKAPKQGELKDTAQEAQQKANTRAPEAAQSIAEAANQMQKSQNSLATAQNNPTAQQASIDALQKADQQLSQDIAQLEQAQKELAQLEEMLQKLQAIIEEQQKVEVATAKEGAKKESSPVKELAGRQEKLGSDTGELQKETSNPVPTAGAHLGTAQKHMGDAKGELDKPQAKTAQPKQKDALKELYAAQREMEKRMNELRDQLGLGPMDNAQSLADAQDLIEQAQRDVDQALSDLQQAPPGLLDALFQQQKQIAKSLGQLSDSSPNTPSVGQAGQSANQAAQNLSEANLPKAINSMKAAQSAMQQTMQSGKQPPTQRNENGEASASLPVLSQQQTDVQKAAEALLKALENASQPSLQQAERSLDNGGMDVSPLTTGKFGPLPPSAQSALQSAQSSMADGAASASSGQGVPSQSSAAAAAKALAQAQAALALAQAGLGSQGMAKNGQGQGKGSGQGQNPGQGKGQGLPGPQGTGKQGNWDGSGGSEGARRNAVGSSAFTGLPARDRAAILQSQSEKYPQEYGPLVEQYLKNLADQGTK